MRSKKAIYNIITNLVLQIIIIIYGFVVPKIIIGTFGSDVNGLISSITQFLAYITLLESGFGSVVKSVLYKPIAKKDNDTIQKILKSTERFFRVISLIFIAYIFLLCFLYPLLVSNNFEYFYTISLIIIISISTFAEYFFGMTYKLFLQADQKTYVISIIQIITYIISVVLIALLAKMGFNIQIIKLISGIVFVFRPIFQNFYVNKKYNINLKKVDSGYKLKQKWDGLAQHIAAVIHSNTDITILTIFTTLKEVSVYSVYYLVVKGVKSVIQAFSNGIDASFGDMMAKNEQENLNNKFNLYETFYLFIIVVIFSITLVLINPFISIYTRDIKDTNYLRPLFGYLLVISEYICMIRLPYIGLTHAAGHFKETRIGAWVECLSNIIISIILVWKYGIVGVTIGTVVAMSIRTVEFIYHSNKYILKRSMLHSLKKIFLIIVITILIIYISKYIPYKNNINYLNWIINAIMISGVTIITSIIIHYIFYSKELNQIIKYMKHKIKNK